MKLWGKRRPGLALGVATILLLAGAALWRGYIIPRASLGAFALDPSNLGAFINIPGGGFVLGAEPFYPAEGPPEKVFVSPFRLQAHA